MALLNELRISGCLTLFLHSVLEVILKTLLVISSNILYIVVLSSLSAFLLCLSISTTIPLITPSFFSRNSVVSLIYFSTPFIASSASSFNFFLSSSLIVVPSKDAINFLASLISFSPSFIYPFRVFNLSSMLSFDKDKKAL